MDAIMSITDLINMTRSNGRSGGTEGQPHKAVFRCMRTVAFFHSFLINFINHNITENS